MAHRSFGIPQPSHDAATLHASPATTIRWRRRQFLTVVMSAMSCAALAAGGCSSLRGKTPEEEEADAKLQKLINVPKLPELVRDAAVPKGMQGVRIDSVAMVSGLGSTGGAPEPSVFRDQLLEDMRFRDVDQPNHVLESPDTAMVQVRGVIPPGARVGDPLDLYVIAPTGAHAQDLHNGWLLETRLRHQQVLKGAIRESEVMALGSGYVLTRADHTPGDDGSLRTTGRVIAGGRVKENRDIGLLIRPDFRHVKTAIAIADAINRRFYFFDGTTRRGIAKPLEDDYVQIEVHPRYRGNEYRMIEIIRAIGLKPESADTQIRLTELSALLKDPATAADAARQLEGMGESGVPTLIDGLKTGNEEIRFYVAEALAYLDRVEAIQPLEEAIRGVAAFRYPALLALQGIDQRGALPALQRLMNESSLETRYGAFCAMRRRPDSVGMLAGNDLAGKFRLFQIPGTGSAAVVASLRESPEIVVFGTPQPLQLTAPVLGTGGLLLQPDANTPSMVKITRFVPQDQQMMMVPSTVGGIVQGIAGVGGGYGDVIATLRICKTKGYLKDPLAIDPLPPPERIYYRDQEGGQSARDVEADWSGT